MGREPFREMLATAARLAKREVRLVAACSQAPDHPVLLSFPESEYLKCVVLQAAG
jgi:23S rRNA (cytosine1962-C5)-methyltransferase